MIKAQGTGNDFVMYADRSGEHAPQKQDIIQLCDRHFGIGADGLIRITRPGHVADLDGHDAQKMRKEGVEWFMDYRNADGTLAEMCGNGTRATAQFLVQQGMLELEEGDAFKLGTRAGVKRITRMPDNPEVGRQLWRVDMGSWSMGAEDEYTVTIPGDTGSGKGTFIDMGNPHVVTVVEDAYSTLPVLGELDLTRAPQVSPELPNGQNVEFARIDNLDTERDLGDASMRVYERGCGETMACGTGLCATAIVLRAKTQIDHWRIRIPGGIVRVDVTDDSVMLTGAAALTAEFRLLQ